MRLNYIDNIDCLEGLREVPDGLVDLIVTDPPYGTMKGLNDRYDWDVRVPAAELLGHLARVTRPGGKAVVFAQSDYTAELMTSALPSLPFCYRAIWLKNQFANHLGCNNSMVSFYEDILIFSKINPKHDFDGANPLRKYFSRVRDYIGFRSYKELNRVLGHRRAEHVFYINTTQFALCTESVYKELTERFALEDMPGFMTYADLRAREDGYRAALIERMNEESPSVFNLWEGKKYKSNVLQYPKDIPSLHPTQKPVALIEDLIQTFSNPGDIVLDTFMGSGTTAVACIKTGRNFIGFELDEGYHAIAQERIAEAYNEQLEELGI